MRSLRRMLARLLFLSGWLALPLLPLTALLLSRLHGFGHF